MNCFVEVSRCRYLDRRSIEKTPILKWICIRNNRFGLITLPESRKAVENRQIKKVIGKYSYLLLFTKIFVIHTLGLNSKKYSSFSFVFPGGKAAGKF
jgi:hypothetical protein